MPLSLKLLSLDQMFHSSKVEPIILNDLHSKTEEDREYFNNLVKETYTSDVVSVLPRCACGELRGEHLVGEVCDVCGTVVKQSIEDDINPSLWFRRPDGVEKLMNPIVWMMLDSRFTKSNFRVLVWITDRNYRSSSKVPESVKELIQMGIPRGYNNFVQNFSWFMEFLFNHADFRYQKSKTSFIHDMLEITHPSRDPLQQLIHDNIGIIFSDFIPVLNRCLLVLEQHALGLYLDSSILNIKDALNTMLSIDQDHYNRTPANIENRTAKILVMLGDYYTSLFRKHISPKPGMLRKHTLGSRTNHSFRAVITSHEEIHDHDEIWIPWCVAMTVFQLHILNRLMNKKALAKLLGKKDGCEKMTHNEALGFIYAHVYKYHPLLDRIMQELISESRGGSIPCLAQRNPSLMQGSAQLVRITRVKTDADNTTVSMSDLIAPAMNADYDGDELNFQLAVDEFMAEKFYAFSPFFNLLLLDKPLEISKNASMSDPIIASVSDWLERRHN